MRLAGGEQVGILTITNVDTGAVLFTAQVKEKDLEHGLYTDKHEDLPRHGHPRPAAPTGVTTVGGPGPDQVTVSWDPVASATSYDLFFTTKSKAAEDEDHEGEDSKKRVKNVTSPFVVSGLDPSTTYYFILRARIDGRKGPRSAEVSGTPSSTTPSSTTTTTAATTTTTAAPTTTTAAPTTTTTTTTSTSTNTTLSQLLGWATYDAYCSTCHGTTGKLGRTAAQISSAISANRGSMGMLVSTSGGDSCHGTPRARRVP